MIPTTLFQAFSVSSSSRDVPLTAGEALSGIFGSVSLACWMFLLLPQLIENYRNQSAEAISLAFILVWFVGDVANLIGALWAGLVPVVVAIGLYFCISDGVLISQVLYYGIRNKRREGRGLLESVKSTVVEADSGPATSLDRERAGSSTSGNVGSERSATVAIDDAAHETSPLLERRRTSNLTIPGSADPSHPSRRRSSTRRRSSAADGNHNDQLSKILEETDSKTNTRLWLKNVVSILAIILIGSLGWLAAYESGAWTPTPPPGSHKGSPASPDPSPSEPDTGIASGAQFLGYLSAVLYLTARIPQIIKNYREKSCEGLSLLFFILSLMGNLTYGAGILCHSVEKEYFMKNLPWLIGSLGTMVEDVAIFVQFKIYDNPLPETKLSARGGDDDRETESAIVG